MIFAIIEDGVVTCMAKANAPLAPYWVPDEGAQIGDRYENGEFIRPEPPAPPVPEIITPRQAKLALLGAGLLSQAEAAIASLPAEQKAVAQIEWEYAHEFRRDWPLLTALAAGMGLTEAQVDELFIIGATL